MAVYSASFDYASNTVPGVQQYFAAIHNGILACGFTDVSASGALSPVYTSRAFPSSWLTDWGYNVYAFNDSISGSAPLFIKLVIGAGASTVGLRVNVQVGNAHNGSGSITSTQQITRVLVSASGGFGLSGSLMYASGDGSRLVLAANPVNNSLSYVFSIERLYDVTGSAVVDGVSIATQCTTNNFRSVDTMLNASGTFSEASTPCIMSTNNSTVFNGAIGYGVIYPIYGRLWNPMKNILVVATNDIGTVGNITSVPVYNTTQSFRYVGAQLQAFAVANNPSTGCWIRWE
jgi:hypothetical protein